MDKFLVQIPEHYESDRLILRSYHEGDGDLFFQASQQNIEHLSKYESGNILMYVKDRQQAESMVRKLHSDWVARNCFFVGLFEKVTNNWVGQIYIGPTNWDLPEFYIGYIADKNYEGKGYISEAVTRSLELLFGVFKAHRVKSDCHEKNERSWKLLERCGFTREGHVRECNRQPDGTIHGNYIYCMLMNEYSSLINGKST